MKERPILMSAPMVRAVLAGTKSQTRRVVTPQPTRWLPNTQPLPGSDEIEIHRGLGWVWYPRKDYRVYSADKGGDFAAGLVKHCRHGAVGERLWVRETWYDDFDRKPGEAHELNIDRFDDGRVEGIEYRASHDCASFEAGCPCNPDGDGKRSEWRPSIFMPRWASRITLEITAVRAQRLDEISAEDCIAEGITLDPSWDGNVLYPRRVFLELWQAINGDRPGCSWSANPWVYALTFRRIDG